MPRPVVQTRPLRLECLEDRRLPAGAIVLTPNKLQFGDAPIFTESITASGVGSVSGASDVDGEALPTGSAVGVKSLIAEGQYPGDMPSSYWIGGHVITSGGINAPPEDDGCGKPPTGSRLSTYVDLLGEIHVQNLVPATQLAMTGRIQYAFAVLPVRPGLPQRDVPVRLTSHGQASVFGEGVPWYSGLTTAASGSLYIRGPGFDSAQPVGSMTATVRLDPSFDVQPTKTSIDQFSYCRTVSAPAGSVFHATLEANATASLNAIIGKTGFQVVVDPAIHVDPSYEFHDDYFVLINTPEVTSPDYVVVTSPWHNALKPNDVNDDKQVVPGDALAVINHINAFGAGPVPLDAPVAPPFIDVTGDLFVAPDDALSVINVINAGLDGEGESRGIIASLHAASAGGSQSFEACVSDLATLDKTLALLAFDAALEALPRRRLR